MTRQTCKQVVYDILRTHTHTHSDIHTLHIGAETCACDQIVEDLPAVPDEPDFTLPRSLERTGHTPREEEKGHAKKPPRASPKRKAAAKAEGEERPISLRGTTRAWC